MSRFTMFLIPAFSALLFAAIPVMARAQDAPASASSTATPMRGMDMTHEGHAPAASADRPADSTGMHDMHARQAAPNAMAPEAQGGMSANHGAGGSMQGMAMGDMQGGRAPPDARDPDYSDGISFPPDHDVHMHGDSRFGMLSLDRLEYVDGDHGHGTALEGQAWYGGDLDRAVLKFEGAASDGHVTDSRIEALWSHAISAYWDAQFGMRHDGGEGPSRNWVAVGIQGLAPYWFDVQATLYGGASGRTAARVELEYEALLTQRLILTPKLEINAYGRDDMARGIARGVSDVGFGLRLRYEIRRRFAPYVGVEWTRRVGASAGLARRQGEPVLERNVVAGVRLWF